MGSPNLSCTVWRKEPEVCETLYPDPEPFYAIKKKGTKTAWWTKGAQLTDIGQRDCHQLLVCWLFWTRVYLAELCSLLIVCLFTFFFDQILFGCFYFRVSEIKLHYFLYIRRKKNVCVCVHRTNTWPGWNIAATLWYVLTKICACFVCVSCCVLLAARLAW